MYRIFTVANIFNKFTVQAFNYYSEIVKNLREHVLSSDQIFDNKSKPAIIIWGVLNWGNAKYMTSYKDIVC